MYTNYIYLGNYFLICSSQHIKRSKNKMWITPGLKLSSKHKNKLYRKWLTSKTMNELNYKNYKKTI